jgi:hypothetical protein
MKFSINMILVIIFSVVFAMTSHAELLVLFDEDAKTEAGAGDFAGLLSTHDAPSTVEITDKDAYSGKVSVYVTPAQSYNPNMNKWSFKIVENPAAKDEYRYIRFAWKSDGGTGVMIQFPNNGNWGTNTSVACVNPPAVGTHRYIAGANVTLWNGVCVSKDIPKDWTLVDRDLFADFDEFTMTGMALTPFSDGGKGDYYDAIMLAANKNEFPKANAVDPKGKLATLWSEVKNEFR